MPTKRTAAAAAVIGAEIYVNGGFISPGCRDWNCKGSSIVESYDPVLDAWTTRPSLPRAKIHPASVATNNGLYVLGGEQQDGIIIGNRSSSVFRYDLASGTWSTVAAMPMASSDPTAVVEAGQIFVIALPAMQYKPASDVWAIMQAPSRAASGPSAAAVNGKIYVFEPTQTWIYDPSKDRP